MAGYFLFSDSVPSFVLSLLKAFQRPISLQGLGHYFFPTFSFSILLSLSFFVNDIRLSTGDFQISRVV